MGGGDGGRRDWGLRRAGGRAVGWTAALCPLSPVPQHLWLSEAVPPPRSSSVSTPGPPRLFSPLSPAAESGEETP